MASLANLAKIVGKTVLKKAPVVGSAAALFWPTKTANDADYLPKETQVNNWEPSEGNTQDNTPQTTNTDNTGSYGSTRQIKNNSAYTKAYSALRDTLDENFGFSRKDEENMYSKISGISNSLKNALASYKQAEMDSLEKDRQTVMADQKSGLKGVARTIESGMKAGNDYLGMKGAANSSASQMYARGLMGEGAKANRSILDDARTQYAEIKTKQNQAEEYAKVQEGQIDRQAEARKDAVKSDYENKRRALAKLASNADDYERADIENQNDQNLREAYAKLNAIDQAAIGWKTELASWKEDMYSRLDGLKNELISLTNFDPEQIQMPKIDSGLEDMSMDTDAEILEARKKRTSLQDFLDNPDGDYSWMSKY